jgi:Zn-dependent peptidase ImmA (M78 family)
MMEDNVRTDIIGDFVNYSAEQLGIERLPQIYLIADREFAVKNRSFGSYVPKTGQLNVYIGNRNLADILRTLAHELVHHRQNELGMLRPDSGETGSPEENEANSLAGELLRNYGKINELIYESKKRKK